jgi:hypothetical protein
MFVRCVYSGYEHIFLRNARLPDCLTVSTEQSPPPVTPRYSLLFMEPCHMNSVRTLTTHFCIFILIASSHLCQDLPNYSFLHIFIFCTRVTAPPISISYPVLALDPVYSGHDRNGNIKIGAVCRLKATNWSA